MTNDYHNEFMDEAYNQSVQQGQMSDPNSLYADYMREEKVRNIIEQINPDSLLEDIEHRIRGQIKNRFTKEWEDISKEYQISELLVSDYISFLGSILNQNTTLSNFSSTQINNLMEMIIDYTRDSLSDNAEKYGFVQKKVFTLPKEIKLLRPIINEHNHLTYKYETKLILAEVVVQSQTDFNEMTRIGNIICMTTFAVFNRALNAQESRRIFDHLSISESNGGKDKKKLGDFLKFWS